ncbi:hypothetical protein BVRB_2g024180 [Beta vulgaris subsp. vulgaris]|nr:hypothetical protein BVRB_2g024180 [Beta vulgaris subsp. vulgaris]
MNHLYTILLLFSLYPPLLSSVSAVFPPLNGKTKDAHKLLSFKFSLLNPEILENWQENSDPCQFSGVICNNSRVSSLNFTSFSLSTNFSSVSTYLFSIDLLTSLSLSSSNISGSLQPFSLCSSFLSEIDLSLNFISGSFSDLSEFSSCSSLTSLNLSYNLLESSKNLGDSHFGISLKTLDVSGNHLSGDQLLPWMLSQGCEKLSHLGLKRNKLEGSFSLSNCSNLEYLDVSFNNISSPMPNFGKFCPKLKHLDLSSNKFVGNIEIAFVGCNSLSSLNVSNNQLTGEIPSLPSSSMEFLYLSNNHFQGMIPQSFADDVCSTLVELDLSFNNLSRMIPTSFESCTLLEVFDVSNNGFSGDLPVDMFLEMKNLKRLNLGFNQFEGTLPDSFSMLSSLESLDLSSNSIAGKIPSGICRTPEGKLSNLKELYLQNNLFIGHIPPTLGNCSQLVSLDLSFNYLTGRIPTSLGSLTQLKDLIMWMNKLDGDIPSELMYNQALENLILDYNELTGSIPSGLSNCTNLNCISLSSNKLGGTIPSWIGNLNNLAILKLSNNSFHGEIPPELGDCKSLLWLDLNSNLLSGSIPPALPKHSGTIGLDVRKKYWYLRNYGGTGCQGTGNLLEFSGIRPDAVYRIPTMCKFQQIYLGHTRPNFNNNGSMIFLDLSYNNLQGSIPKELGTMFYLWILNLGHNNLSGEIPEDLAGMKNIGVMYLSHNHLSGPIPPSLGSLSSLTDMDLSYNELSGMIPATAQFETFPPSRFLYNPGLCGYPLPTCDRHAGANSSQHQKHGKRKGFLAGSVAMGLFFSLFCIFGLIIVAIEVKKRRKKNFLQDSYMDYGTHSHSGNYTTSAWKFTSKREALSINLATFENPLQKLTFADLLEATNGFHDDSLIGQGGFGDVYKAVLKDGTVVAIKKLIQINVLHGVSTLAGTPGYVPPEYYQSFRCSAKGDVYSYGVVLLELLTGKHPTHSPDFGEHNNLVGWVKMHAKLRITDVFDPELLKEDPNLEMELLQHLNVACACLDDRSSKRPTMVQVMTMFKEIQAGSGIESVSTITADVGSFSSSVDVLDMSIEEVPESEGN